MAAAAEALAGPQAGGQGPHAKTRRFPRARYGARVVHVRREVGARLDPGHDEVGPLRQQLVHPEVHAIGRRSGDRPSVLSAREGPDRIPQRQRVGLLRLLVSKAKLWLLDEPFSALDAQSTGMLKSLIEGHLAAQGMVILTAHQALPFEHCSYKAYQL